MDVNEIDLFWKIRIGKYNRGLLISGILAGVLYMVIGQNLIQPYDHEFEITIFHLLFQGILYAITMGLANICFFFGYLLDKFFNLSMRETLYKTGYYFSVALPFLVPLILLIYYFRSIY